MSELKFFQVQRCSLNEIKHFIETWHYSHNTNGINAKFCFKIENSQGELIGAMIYGRIAMANVWKKYVENEECILELRRLCCIDNTPKNTESYFIGKTLRWLKKHTSISHIISYADEEYGHTGIIYKASNFKHCGTTKPGRIIIYNNKIYHDKTIRTKYKGDLKPFAKKIKQALDSGEAFYKKTKQKHIYIYHLK